jgi:Glycosyltransferase like family
MSVPPATVSVVCVYNDLAVRQQCLDRSFQAHDAEASDVEYLPIDNVTGTYSTAGAALNHGASLAKNDVVVFVHQDVFLHSLSALKQAAGQLLTGGFGLLGAVGIDSNSQMVGRIRDRVLLVGEAVTCPADVDSVDEVLFMVPRTQLLSDPLTESHELAWHGYAVEYGLRVRNKGMRTGVADIPLTHNSLSTNIDRLDVAHRAIAARYGDLLPVWTTCGMITRDTARTGGRAWLSSHRWRYRWLRDSLALRRARRPAGRTAGVIADIRHDVDGIIGRSPGRRLHIVNCSQGSEFVDGSPDPFELQRRDGRVVFTACSASDVPAKLASGEPGSWFLVTNLSRADLQMIRSRPSATPGVLGFHTGTGLWLLLGAPIEDLPPQWSSKRATPLGMRALVANSSVRQPA